MHRSGEPAGATPRPFGGLWKGENKLVIGIDIGTTQSGVAYTVLEHGQKQTLHRVVKWPGQGEECQRSKVPTVVWYDANKKAVSFGAEALSHDVEDKAEDEGWTLAKHFKLHLHPDDMKARHDLRLDSLPPGISLRQIYIDFLGYLLKHTQSFFEDRTVDGELIWQRYKPTMEIILAHPNGWGIREQTFLREVVVGTGFVNDSNALKQVRFVTEAEASVHFCIQDANLESHFQPSTIFAVCDAGGSTVDTTLYSVASLQPIMNLEEKHVSACVQAGSIFVDAEAERYLHCTLSGAGCSDGLSENCKAGAKDFESYAKRKFSDENQVSHINFGDRSFTESSIRIRRGRMELPGTVMKALFKPCLDEIISSVDEQLRNRNVSHILLVGGFGESPYLRNEFKKRYEPRGCQITLTNDASSKAVADGAVIWSIIDRVITRIPRFSYGLTCTARYYPFLRGHQERTPFVQQDGDQWVNGSWSQIATKGTPLDVKTVCRRPFTQYYTTPTPYSSPFEVPLIAHTGTDEPKWSENPQGTLLHGFRHVCRITTNLSNLSGALKHKVGKSGKVYWELEFDACIRFAGTELKAFLEWKEHGVTCTGPMTVIPEDEL